MKPALLLRRLATFCLTLLCCLLASPSFAEVAPGASKFPLNRDDPVSAVPNPEQRRAAPLDFGYWLMEASAQGTQALEAGHFDAASRYFEALAIAAPDRSIVYSKLCESYMGAGHLERALQNCRQALGQQGVKGTDYLRYIRLKLILSSKLSPDEVTEIDEIFQHLKQSGVIDPTVHELSCEVGLRTRDVPRLQNCIAELERVAPGQPKLTAFRWSLALIRDDQAEAERVLEKARAQGFPPELIEKMRKAATLGSEPPSQLNHTLLIVAFSVLAALGAVLALGYAHVRYQTGTKLV